MRLHDEHRRREGGERDENVRDTEGTKEGTKSARRLNQSQLQRCCQQVNTGSRDGGCAKEENKLLLHVFPTKQSCLGARGTLCSLMTLNWGHCDGFGHGRCPSRRTPSA